MQHRFAVIGNEEFRLKSDGSQYIQERHDYPLLRKPELISLVTSYSSNSHVSALTRSENSSLCLYCRLGVSLVFLCDRLVWWARLTLRYCQGTNQCFNTPSHWLQHNFASWRTLVTGQELVCLVSASRTVQIFYVCKWLGSRHLEIRYSDVCIIVVMRYQPI